MCLKYVQITCQVFVLFVRYFGSFPVVFSTRPDRADSQLGCQRHDLCFISPYFTTDQFGAMNCNSLKWNVSLYHLYFTTRGFSQNRPLGQFNLYVAMSVCCMSSPPGNYSSQWIGDLWYKSLSLILDNQKATFFLEGQDFKKMFYQRLNHREGRSALLK